MEGLITVRASLDHAVLMEGGWGGVVGGRAWNLKIKGEKQTIYVVAVLSVAVKCAAWCN